MQRMGNAVKLKKSASKKKKSPKNFAPKKILDSLEKVTKRLEN